MSTGKGKIFITEDSDALARKGAEMFHEMAVSAVSRNGRFSVAISGGSTPRSMNRLLAQHPFASAIPWQLVHLFMVDERMVPYDDPASNFGAARADWLDHVPIPPENLHPMPVDEPPGKAAERYAKELKLFFDPHAPVFDLIFLGIGTDGHTASLFPGDTIALESKQWVIPVKGGNPNVHRLSLTFNIINQGRNLIFLMTGESKAPLLKALHENLPHEYPSGRVQPVSGELIWLVDRAAASLLAS